MRVIKDRIVIEDDWVLLHELDDVEPAPAGNVILPFAYWQANCDELLKSKANHAIWIDGSVEIEKLLKYLEQLSMIALDFPVFKDGRSYSHARLLRDRYSYKGDIRAIGDVLRDQLFFMQRCGISSYQIREDKDINEALKGLDSFSLKYQTAADAAVPIYKLR